MSASQEIDVSTPDTTPVSVSITSAGDLEVGTISSSEGDVSLTSTAGSVLDAFTDGATNVSADTIKFSAGGTVGTSADLLRIDSAYGGSGDVNVRTAQGVWLDQVAGNLSLGSIVSAGQAALESAKGAILDGGSPGTTVLQATDANLTAATGIGTSSKNPIQIDVNQLSAAAGDGVLSITNAAAPTIASPGLSATGDIDLVADGALQVNAEVVASGVASLVATGDLIIPGGVLVQSTGGQVILSTGGHLDLMSGATLDASSTISIMGTDTSGDTIDVAGTLTATTASISTVGGGSVINIDSLPGNVVLTVLGGTGDGNALNITGTPGNDTFTISATQVQTQVGSEPVTINYSGIALLTINGDAANQGGNDTFVVNGTSAATTLQGGPGNDTVDLSAAVDGNNDPVLDVPVTFLAGNGQDAVNVTGPRATAARSWWPANPPRATGPSWGPGSSSSTKTRMGRSPSP